MAESMPEIDDEAADERPDPPGALVVADRVGVTVAERAALGVDGVVEYRSSVGGLLGGNKAVRSVVGGVYPHAQIDLSAPMPRLSLQVAVTWPSKVTEVCHQLRVHVADELDRLAGVRPAAVDVEVAVLVPRAEVRDHRSGLVTLPPVLAEFDDAAHAADDGPSDDGDTELVEEVRA